MNVFRLEMMHWPEIRSKIGQGVRTVIVPVGSTEQHGPHLPLSTDTLVTEAIVERLASFFAPVGCIGTQVALHGDILLGVPYRSVWYEWAGMHAQLAANAF